MNLKPGDVPGAGELLLASYGSDLDAPQHSMLGLRALTDTMQDMGVPVHSLLEGTGIAPSQLEDADACMSHRQKMVLFANVQRLTPDPAVGLVAGQRQRLSDFGVFGYALTTSATFGQAIRFGFEHLQLAGPMLQKSFRVDGDEAVFGGHDLLQLGALLPLVCEFWLASAHALIGHVLGQPFRANRLLLPYAAPRHAGRYPQVFGCPVLFDAEVLQWHFDASLLGQPLPDANPITARLSADFCARMLAAIDGEGPLVRAIREACMDSAGGFPGAAQMAERLHMSPRTLHRRLVEAGTSYQDVLDGLRRRLAIEFLQRTGLSIDQIAERSGYSDTSNFRKAFKKWTGQSPGYFRQGKMAALPTAAH